MAVDWKGKIIQMVDDKCKVVLTCAGKNNLLVKGKILSLDAGKDEMILMDAVKD